MIAVTCSGRTFTEEEVEFMRVVAHDYAGLGVTEIAGRCASCWSGNDPTAG